MWQWVATSLTPGNWYYISVDNYNNTGYRGTFTLCITDVVDYDFREGAYEITDYDGWCSADQQFTTLGATADGVAGTCWPNGPSYNRWFRFQATGTEAMFNVQTGGDQGTLRYPLAALYDTLGNEIACARYTNDYNDVSIGTTGLTPGEWYFLSVDNYTNGGYRGTFTLCADDQVDYDFKLGAIELTDIDNWCSTQEAYTTLGASPDELAGTCWPQRTQLQPLVQVPGHHQHGQCHHSTLVVMMAPCVISWLPCGIPLAMNWPVSNTPPIIQM